MNNILNKRVSHDKKDKILLHKSELKQYFSNLTDWQIRTIDKKNTLYKSYKLNSFSHAIQFAEKINVIANKNDHHPRLIINWGKLEIYWWSHDMGGINMNDVIMAHNTDTLFKSM